MKLPFPLGARQRGAAEPQPTSRSRRRTQTTMRVAALALVSAVVAALAWRSYATRTAVTPPIAAPVSWGNLDINIESSGTVRPARSIDLPFQTSGQVREVLVKPGEQVRSGQPLARLDDRELRLQLQQAEADLQSANAALAAASNGSATAQDITKAQASLQASLAELEKVRTGNITAADISEAQASLTAAQARLDALRNPAQDKLSSATTTLTQAQSNLQQVRDSASAEKTNAQLELEQAAAELTKAQASYSSAKSNWDYIHATGKSPSQTNLSDQERARQPGISDVERQQYYSTYIQAEASLRQAEGAVERAQVTYDTARQQEPIKVQEAEARLADAQQQLSALSNPSAAALTEAQADVDSARARLDQLRQGGTRADMTIAEAQVNQARASLEQLSAPAAASEIAQAQAQQAQAQAQLASARLKLDQATLTAPFDGTIASVDITAGEILGSTTSAITLIDRSELHLEIQLSENDIMRVAAGQPVAISFDTLEGQSFKGSVQAVAEAGSESQNVVTYLVTVTFDPADAPIKVGMTAGAQILVERHQNVFQVPSRAIRRDGPIATIEVLFGEQQDPVTVPVETGASDGPMTEIVRCLNTGNQCLRQGDQVRIELPTTNTTSGAEPQGAIIGGPAMPAGAPNIVIRGP